MAFGINKGVKGPKNLTGTFDLTLIPARVLSVVLDTTTYKDTFTTNGEYRALGGITFRPLVKPNTNIKQEGTSFALPYFANLQQYPVEGELVLILAAGRNTNVTGTDELAYYYLPPTNAWASTHLNIASNLGNNQNKTSNTRSINQVLAGTANREVPDYTPTYFYDYGIKERSTVRPLLPQPGDVSIQGRWGQSIRLGSTNRSALPNTWSSVGDEGDSLIILRNNQYLDQAKPWIPLPEDINRDGASIYFTSTQKININTPLFKVKSFKNNPPVSPSEYTKDQIILSSGRLLFSTKEDNIVLTSIKSIHLSGTSINVDSAETTVSSNKIQLGGTELLQPVLKGDDTVDCLTRLLTQLTSFMTVVAATKLPGISDAATTIIPELTSIQAKVNTQLKSNITYTK
jgi:hypothetical protein